MKGLLILLLAVSTLYARAQQRATTSVFVALYGPYATQPGFKAGATFALWDCGRTLESKTTSRLFYASPQLGLFHRISNHTSYIGNLDLGYRRSASDRKNYISSSVGLGYLWENQTISSTVDLSSGNITARDKDLRRYFLPTLSIELGKNRPRTIGWYSKLSYGRKISRKLENTGFFALEIGASIALQNATKKPSNSSE